MGFHFIIRRFIKARQDFDYVHKAARLHTYFNKLILPFCPTRAVLFCYMILLIVLRKNCGRLRLHRFGCMGKPRSRNPHGSARSKDRTRGA
jgi:hypothetical protein